MAEMLLIFKTQYVCRAAMEWSGVELSDDYEMMLCREILCTRTFDNLRNRRKAVPTEVNWGLRKQGHSIVVQSKSLPKIKQRSLRMRLTLKEKKKKKRRGSRPAAEHQENFQNKTSYERISLRTRKLLKRVGKLQMLLGAKEEQLARNIGNFGAAMME